MSNIELTNAPNPMHDRVTVLPDEQKSVTEGGIVLPDAAQEVPVKGTVLKVGPLVTSLTPGMRVYYSMYGGDEIDKNGTVYRIVRESDIYGYD